MENCGIKTKIFFRFFLSYISMLIVALLIGLSVYNEAIKAVKSQAHETNVSALAQGKDILSKRLMDIESMVIQLSLNEKITSLLNSYNPAPDEIPVYKVMEAQRAVYPYMVTNNFIGGFYIYLKEKGIIVSPYASYFKEAYFYDQAFRYGDLDYYEWQSRISDRKYKNEFLPSAPVVINSQKRSMITYLQKIPLDGVNGTKGVITVFIDENEIRKVLNSLLEQGCACVYIYDRDGNILTCISNGEDEFSMDNVDIPESEGFFEKVIDGEKMFIFHTVSSYNGWRYVATFPNHIVMSRVNNVKQILCVIMSASFLLGIMIAYCLAFQNNKPIKKLVFTLVEQVECKVDHGKNVYDFINNSVSQLIYNNKAIKEDMQKQLSLLRTAFFDRLFNGKFSTLKEIEAFSRQIDLDIKNYKIAVLILRLTEAGEKTYAMEMEQLNTAKVLLKNLLKKYAGGLGYWHDVDIDEIAVLITLKENETDGCRENIEGIIWKVKAELWENYSIKIFCAAGGIGESMLEAGHSLEEARHVLEYNAWNKDKRILWYSDIPKNKEAYYYPLDTELRLINLARTGNVEEVQKILKDLFTENIIKRKLSAFMLKQFVYNLRGTLIKLFDQIAIVNTEVLSEGMRILERMECCSSVHEMFLSVTQVYDSLCNAVDAQKKSHNTRLKEQIIDYIHIHFSDAGLCLSWIAKEFHISELYLSQFFKEQMGENISQFIEKVRMKHACDLLLNTDLKINQIAEKSGYYYVQVFRRAFKRIYGVSPSDYLRHIIDHHGVIT